MLFSVPLYFFPLLPLLTNTRVYFMFYVIGGATAIRKRYFFGRNKFINRF